MAASKRHALSVPAGPARSLEAGMALTESTYTPLGSSMPAFHLQGVDGRSWRQDDFRTQALLIVFMCNHCPYVQAMDDRINALALAYRGRCAVVAINSNDPDQYPEDSLEAMGERALEKGYTFHYLFDETQEVARAFGAVCTPDFFLFGSDRTLAYRGRLDDSWKDPSAVTREDLKEAIEAVLSGKAPITDPKPSMGCSIKWRN